MIAALLMTLALAAGTDVGNGGDVVDCIPAASSRFRGLHATDYLLTLGPGDEPLTADVSAGSLDQSLRRIQAQLDRLYPEMGLLFGEYTAELGNFTDWTRERIWTPAAHGLIDVQDERIVRRLPANCTGGSDPGVVHLIQAVIRQVRPRTVQYQVDFEILRRLELAPLQYSYLIVHEWLRDLTDDPETIRWANRLLHSRPLEQMDADTFKANLDGIGITLAHVGLDRVCLRTDVVRSALEEILGKPCDLITPEDLRELNPIDPQSQSGIRFFAMSLLASGLESLRLGDFAGLHHLRKLELSNNGVERVSADHFAGLSALNVLTMARNRLVEAPAGIFDRLPQLSNLDLQANRITRIPPRFLRNAYDLQHIDLSFNQLEELPADFLVTRRRARLAINLTNNRISRIPPGFLDAVPPRGPGNQPTQNGITLHLQNNPIPREDVLRLQREAETKNLQIFF
jgi:hypothetical protein